MDSDNKTKLTWVGVLRLVVGGIFRLISIIALLAVLGISYLLFQNAKQTKETQDLNVQLVEMRQEAETEEDNTDWSKGMLDINSDYKGWLTIYGTQISEPVVQGETNETYLRTNINGEHAEAGTLFLDETTDLTQDGNLIIYGHKMNDGTMFGTLDKFEDEEFLDNNGTVCWESEKGKEYYQIFALLVLPGYSTAPDFIDLQAWNNVLDEEQTADMLNTIADRASIFRGESFNLEKDKYIFLVTCDYSINNGRLVLVGRRLSKKSETEDTTEENTDNTEEAVSEEENCENVEQFGRRILVTLVVGGFATRPSRKLCRFQAA